MKLESNEARRILERMIGTWTFVVESDSADPQRHVGTEVVRSLDGVWIIGEARGAEPGGKEEASVLILGYDPERERFVGTFVGNGMTYLWTYEGEADDAGDRLVLHAEGPSFVVEGETAKYMDTMTFEGPDVRTLTSRYLGDDGDWHAFMKMTYRRAE